MGIKLTKDKAYNLLRHLMFHNVAVLSCLSASREHLKKEKLPLFISDSINEMIYELTLDLQDALEPMLEILEEEYKNRPDRMIIVNAISSRLEQRKKSQAGYEPCHCAACEDNRSLAEDEEVKPKTKPFNELMKKRLVKDEIDEIEFEVRQEANKLKKGK